MMKILEPQFNTQQLLVGISACVLGQQVRFDGGHKRSTFADNELGQFVQYVPICPEVAIGMGVPRPTIRQVAHGERILIKGSGKHSELDVSEALSSFSQTQSHALQNLSGYIVCAKSPTCGLERVKVYSEQGHLLHSEGRGVFTQALMDAHPLLPIEENGRLCDPVLKENFVNRVFVFHQWQCLCHEGLSAKKLIDFHSRHKYLVMASSVEAYQKLGRLLANLSGESMEDVAAIYSKELMAALTLRASRKGHTNVLLHLQGYFKNWVDSAERQALAAVIHQYRQGILPLMAPIVLIKHLLVKFPNEYLSQQVYLNPHPELLALRNQL